jgi:hypothetical protein
MDGGKKLVQMSHTNIPHAQYGMDPATAKQIAVALKTMPITMSLEY